jgi:dTDP-4-dehydrorhamnose 3,5-epimerase-like enzyme
MKPTPVNPRTSSARAPEPAPDHASARLIQLPEFRDARGALGVIEFANASNHGGAIPFEPKRLYYITGVAANAQRGGHAHLREQEFILCLHGSFTVLTDNGSTQTSFRMQFPNEGLHIPALVWHELHDFSRDAVCAVLASEAHDPADYLREHSHFLDFLKALPGGHSVV